MPRGCAAIVEQGTSLCVATVGPDGGAWAARGRGGSSGTVPGFKVEVVDATGCGDAFMAALLVRALSLLPPGSAARRAALEQLTGKQLAEALRWANAAGHPPGCRGGDFGEALAGRIGGSGCATDARRQTRKRGRRPIPGQTTSPAKSASRVPDAAEVRPRPGRSALAAPALAGIPLTHRGLSTGFTVVSGHAEESYRPILSAVPPGASTLVVLMGLGTRGRIAALLLGAGWPAETPAAALLGASTSEAKTWIGTLAELGEVALDGGRAPGTLVIGGVAALGETRTLPARGGRIHSAGLH